MAKLQVATETEARRAERLAAIRAEIAAGTYETPEKMQAALAAFLDGQDAGGLEAGDDLSPRQPR